jgi:hypothetical protein
MCEYTSPAGQSPSGKSPEWCIISSPRIIIIIIMSWQHNIINSGAEGALWFSGQSNIQGHELLNKNRKFGRDLLQSRYTVKQLSHIYDMTKLLILENLVLYMALHRFFSSSCMRKFL